MDRYFVGADRVMKRLADIADQSTLMMPIKYPPYNIKKVDENRYVIELAVAGFNEDEISVEILKGNQSSLYGSGAIGGTIHITTKRGEPGFKKDVNYTTGSHGTHNLSTSLSGGNEETNYFVGLQRFQTDGISQMTHNTEKDRYRNNGLIASFDNKFSEIIVNLDEIPDELAYRIFL